MNIDFPIMSMAERPVMTSIPFQIEQNREIQPGGTTYSVDGLVISEADDLLTTEDPAQIEQNIRAQSGPVTYSDDDRKAWASARDAYNASSNIVKPEGWPNSEHEKYWHHFDYIKAGAIVQPADGDNVKVSGRSARCLTCCRQNRGCDGTSVLDGKCECCRAARGGTNARKRRCVWLNPEKNLFTYPDAQSAAGFNGGNYKKAGPKSAPKPRPKRKSRKAAEAVDVEQATSAAPNAATAQSTFFQLNATTTVVTHIKDIENDSTKKILQQAAKELVKEKVVTQEALANTHLLFNKVTETNYLRGPIEELLTRIVDLEAQVELTQILAYMATAGMGVGKDEVELIAQEE